MKMRYCYVGILLVATAFFMGSVNCASGAEVLAQWSGQLSQAVKESNLDKVKDFISNQGASANSSMRYDDGTSDTLLDFAINAASEVKVVEIVKYLLENGATLTQTGKTTLHRAVLRGNEALVKLIFNTETGRKLLNEKWSTDDKILTPLQLAVMGNKRKIGIVKYLVEQGAQLYPTLLHEVIRVFPSSDELNTLIDEILKKDESFLNAQDAEGNTPLHKAIGEGPMQVKEWEANRQIKINALLKYKPNLSIQDRKYKRSPFYLAAITGDFALVKKLAANPKLTINFNEKDSQGMTLLYRYASLFPKGLVFNEDIFKLLLSKGASLAEKNGHAQETVLHAVLENMNNSSDTSAQAHGKKVFDLIFDKTVCDQNKLREALLVANKGGITPLQYALGKNDKSSVEVSVEVVAKILTVVEDGDDAYKKRFKTEILDKRAGGLTPLHQALAKGFGREIVKRLLALGANPLIKTDDDYPRTALSYAWAHQQITDKEEICKVLEKAEKRALQPSVQPLPVSEELSQSSPPHNFKTNSQNKDPQIKQPQKQDFPANPENRGTSTTSGLPSGTDQDSGKSSLKSKIFIGAVIAIPTIALLIHGIKKIMRSKDKQQDENGETTYNRQKTAYTL